MKRHPLTVLDFSFRPWTDEMSFGTLWRHSECDGDLNQFEAGLGMHYVEGIIPGSGQGLFQKIEFVPPRGEMRLKKLSSRRRGGGSFMATKISSSEGGGIFQIPGSCRTDGTREVFSAPSYGS